MMCMIGFPERLAGVETIRELWYNTRMIRSKFYAPQFLPPVKKIVIDSGECYVWPVEDAYIYLRAKEFFAAYPKEKEVHIDVPSRGISMLIDREHPEVK